jgi:hypothetical protein
MSSLRAEQSNLTQGNKQALDCFVAGVPRNDGEAAIYSAATLLSVGRLASSDCSVVSVD